MVLGCFILGKLAEWLTWRILIISYLKKPEYLPHDITDSDNILLIYLNKKESIAPNE